MVKWELEDKDVGALQLVFHAACKQDGMNIAPTCVYLAAKLQQAVGQRPAPVNGQGEAAPAQPRLVT